MCSSTLSSRFLSPCWQKSPQILHSTFSPHQGSVYTPSFHSPYWGPTQSCVTNHSCPWESLGSPMPRVMCIHLPVAGGCVWGEQEVIKVSDIKAKPREEWAQHCYTAMHHQESWTSCLIYRQLQGCSVLWNRCHMGKHVSSIFPVSILDFQESPRPCCLSHSREAGRTMLQAVGQAGGKGACPAFARSAKRQQHMRADVSPRQPHRQSVALCLVPLSLKTPGTVSSLCLKSLLCLGFS